MKITNIIEETKSISSDIKNAYIDFSKMTISLVAVCSDIKKMENRLSDMVLTLMVDMDRVTSLERGFAPDY